MRSSIFKSLFFAGILLMMLSSAHSAFAQSCKPGFVLQYTAANEPYCQCTGSSCTGGSNSVFAQSTGSSGSGGSGGFGAGGSTGGLSSSGKLLNPLGFDSITEVLLAILDVLVIFMIPIIILFIIYAGFLYVTARGNQSTIETAHRTLLYAVIGGLLILGARALLAVIQGTVNMLM